MSAVAERPPRAGDTSAHGLRPRTKGPRVRPGFALLQTLAYAAITAVAATTLWPIYQGRQFVLVVAAGFALGAVIALAGAFLRLASFWVLLLMAIAFGLFGVALAVPNQAVYGVVPTAEGLRELVAGVATSWKQLLTITLPVGSYQALLVPVLLLVLVGTTVGLSIALRTGRAELALIPPVVLYLVGIVFGPPQALLPIVTGLALLAASILWVVWWRLRRRRQAIDRLVRATPGSTALHQRSGNRAVARRAVGGAVITLAIAAIGSAVATTTLAPVGARWVARDAVVKPFDPRDYVSPLSGFRAYEQTPTVRRAQLTVTGLRSGQFLRIAALDTYNGVEYSVGSDQVSTQSGTFSRVPTSFDQSKQAGTQQTIDVAIDGYSGVWLPTVGKLESIDFSGSEAGSLRDSFFYNDTTGTAAVVGDVSRGVSYRLSAVDPTQPAASALAGLTPGSASVPSPSDVPAALKTRLQSYVDGVTGQGARLQAALRGLRADGYVSHGVGPKEPVSRSGHGADRLTQLFTDQLMIGDGEQYAAAAALMADQLGFPARVVLGFASTESTGGTTTFTGADITARIEVDTARYGWVMLDPNPPVRAIPDTQKTDPNQTSRPQSVIQPPPKVSTPQNTQTQPQSQQDQTADQPAWIAILLVAGRIAGWVALGAGIIMAPFLVIVAIKARRRRRRRKSRDPAVRMTDGWREYQDAVVDHGIDAVPSATRSEVATVVGSSRAGVLARVVDRSVFAPEPAGQSEADRVWKAVGEMRAGLDDGLTGWQRFKAAVSTRSLRGYHGRKPSKR